MTVPTTGLMGQVQGLLAAEPSSWDLAELEQGLVDLAMVAPQLLAVQMRMLAAFDARGGGQIAGQRSTADWLHTNTRLSPGRAGWAVHTARELRDELPATAQALADGEIGEQHLRAIRQGRRRLGDQFGRIEAIVVDHARRHTDRETRLLIDRLVQQYCPEDHDDDAEVDRERRRLHLSDSTDGWWHLDGLLDPATGAALAAAMDVFAEAPGHRTFAQRRSGVVMRWPRSPNGPVTRWIGRPGSGM